MSDENETTDKPAPKPTSYKDMVAKALTEEEQEEVEIEGVDGESDVEIEEKKSIGDRFNSAITDDKEDATDDVPDWAIIPDDIKIPRGKKVTFMRLRARLTDAPEKGDRIVLLWTLSVSDEKAARRRVMDSNDAVPEMAKQTVRAVDGRMIDWTGTSNTKKAKMGLIKAGLDINTFWNEIGPMYRQMIQNLYLRTHVMAEEDQLDFFMNCIVVRSTVGA